MPLRAARFRRAALAALAAGCALALSACSLMQGATLTPVAPQINAAAGDAPVFFEESISGGTIGNAFFGTGEFNHIATGDTEGRGRGRRARGQRPGAGAAREHGGY